MTSSCIVLHVCVLSALRHSYRGLSCFFVIRSRTFFDGSKGFVLFSEEYKKSEPFSYRKKVRILLMWCTSRDSNTGPTDSESKPPVRLNSWKFRAIVILHQNNVIFHPVISAPFVQFCSEKRPLHVLKPCKIRAETVHLLSDKQNRPIHHRLDGIGLSDRTPKSSLGGYYHDETAFLPL